LNGGKGHALCKNWVQSAADEGKILLTTFDQLLRRGIFISNANGVGMGLRKRADHTESF